jgi:hypothetical protein
MAAENKKFNVGDKVIAVRDTPTVAEGWIGFVTANTPFNGYEIFAEGETGHEAFYETELELLGANQATSKTSIKSDGGSSSYYELTITNKAGESIKCETGDVIRALVGNDFDFGNCVKALRRMYLASLGMGKEGTNIPYDCNKIRYFISEIERVNK